MRKTLFILCFTVIEFSIAQKDCNKVTRNYIPLTDMGTSTFNGFGGGLYANGQNHPSGMMLQDAMMFSKSITCLDSGGLPDAKGKIVMIGVGASNPRTEFQAFQKICDTFKDINKSLLLVNTCIGGQGVQKMNDPSDNYWKQALHTFDSLNINFNQVQIAWIETDNTQNGDTLFPRAAQSLSSDLRTLLITLKNKFPNLKLCYFSARAYTGWVSGGTGKGLEHPRDYYNGWGIKWLIDSAANQNPRYRYSGTNPLIPLPLFSSYMWTNGEQVRHDSFSIDCETYIGGDGLHLSALGEEKLATLIFDFFSNDATSVPWFIESQFTELIPLNASKAFTVYPNPASKTLFIQTQNTNSDDTQIKLFNFYHQEIYYSNDKTGLIEIDISNLANGLYFVECKTGAIASIYKILKQ